MSNSFEGSNWVKSIFEMTSTLSKIAYLFRHFHVSAWNIYFVKKKKPINQVLDHKFWQLKKKLNNSMISMSPQMCFTFWAWKSVFECYLKTEQLKRTCIQNTNALREILFVFSLFAIFNFWRRKFDRDPGLSLPLKSNSEVSKMFTRFEFI